MGRVGSTTSRCARQMRRVLGRWERSGLSLREFGEQRGIPVSTLSWWRQVFRRAGEPANAASQSVRASDAATRSTAQDSWLVTASPQTRRSREPMQLAKGGAGYSFSPALRRPSNSLSTNAGSAVERTTLSVASENSGFSRNISSSTVRASSSRPRCA
jgi:hypothetical protein